MPVDYALKHCLVIGASGFVGKVLCQQLQNNRVPVRALLRHNQPGPWNEFVLCDLNNFSSRPDEIFSGIDTIFYLASIAHNKAPASSYEDFNVQICLQFAKAAIQHGVKRFIYVSSVKAICPEDAYGLSKLRAEEGLLALSGFEHLAIVRPCLIYGRGIKGNLFAMLKWIDLGIFPSLPEVGEKRSMISVGDVASALILCATNSNAHRQVYVVTDEKEYSLKEIENFMRKALQKHSPFLVIPKIFLKMMFIKLLKPAIYSSEKIRHELHWCPTESFLEVLPEMVDDLVLRKKQK